MYIFVTVDEPTLIHHYHLESVAHLYFYFVAVFTDCSDLFLFIGLFNI